MVRIAMRSAQDVAAGQVDPVMESFKMASGLESAIHSTAPLLWRDGGEMKTSAISERADDSDESEDGEDKEEEKEGFGDECGFVGNAKEHYLEGDVQSSWDNGDGLLGNFCDGEGSPTNHLMLRHMLTPLRAVSFRTGLSRRGMRRILRGGEGKNGRMDAVSRMPSSVAMAVACAAAEGWQEEHPAVAHRPKADGRALPTPVTAADLWNLWVDLKKQPLDGNNDERFHSSSLRERARLETLPPVGRRWRLNTSCARQMLYEVVRGHQLWGLTSLDLSCSKLGDRGAYAVADGLLKTRHSTQSTLRTLSLRRCNLTSRGVHYLCLVLRQCPYLALQTLSLTKNRIDGDGARWLSEYLSLPHCRLAVLFLRSNAVDDRGLAYLARALGRAGRNTSLVLLSLAKNYSLTSKGVAALSRALAWNRTLRVLNLGHNRSILGSVRVSSSLVAKSTRRKKRTHRLFPLCTSHDDHGDGIQHLTAGLSHLRSDDATQQPEPQDYRSRVTWTKPTESSCSSVVALDLRYIPMNISHKNSAIHHISDMLTNTPRLELRILALSYCQLGDDGVEMLSRSGGGSLQRLWLDGNAISCRGATAMANLCLAFPSCQLKTLSLRENKIGMEGVTAIAAALSNNSENSNLIELHLQRNNPAGRRAPSDARVPNLLDAISQRLERNRNRQLSSCDKSPTYHNYATKSAEFSVSPMSTPRTSAYDNRSDDLASLFRQQVQQQHARSKNRHPTVPNPFGSAALPASIWSPTGSSFSTASSLTKSSLCPMAPTNGTTRPFVMMHDQDEEEDEKSNSEDYRAQEVPTKFPFLDEEGSAPDSDDDDDDDDEAEDEFDLVMSLSLISPSAAMA